ncbi:hypothetical protein STIAU_4919, partial [Stigmatella aurantiaca DW4/3-1]
GAAGGKIALEDGKLTIGAKVKGALGVGLGFEGSTTIDFKKLGNTIENVTGVDVGEKAKEATEGVKDIAKDVGEGIKDVGNSIKDTFKSIF